MTQRAMKVSYNSLIICIIFLLIFARPINSFAEDVGYDELPSLIDSYSLYASHYKYFNENSQKKNNANWYSVLEKNFDKLSCGINTRLCFTHVSFVIQPYLNNIYGDYPEGNKKQARDILFISTPIETLENKILVVLSSVAPEHVTVMTVDSHLNASLLYDSFSHSDKLGLICSLSHAQVMKDSIIKFFEKDGGRCNPPENPKVLLFNMKTGSIDIQDAQ